MSSIDEQIKDTAHQLKKLLAEKQGLTLKEYEIQQMNQFANKKIDNSRFQFTSLKFQCPRCKGLNTKRTGTTTQIHPKARFLCFDCQYDRKVTRKKDITPFFTLDNKQMKTEIDSKEDLTNKQRRIFYEKYLIKEINK